MLKKIVTFTTAFILIALVILAIWLMRSNNNTGLFTTNAKGLKVIVNTEPTGISKTITESGGEVKSAALTLKIPNKSIQDKQTVSVKKIISIKNLPKGAQFLSGADITPNGIKLDKSASLSLSLPAAKQNLKLIGFSYSADGKDFSFYPAKMSANTATFKLSGFSGYGILILKDDNVTLAPPSTIEKQAKSFIAAIAKKAALNTGGLSEDALSKIKNILRGWYNASVKPNLESAIDDPNKIDSSVHEFLSWKATAEFFGLDDSFKDEIYTSLDTIAEAIKKASEKAYKLAVKDKDPEQAVKLLRYAKLVQLLGLDGRAGVSSDKINDMVAKVLNFELKIKSRIITASQGAKKTVEASGQAAILFQKNMKLAGRGEVRATKYRLNSTVGKSNVAEVWDINMPEFSLGVSKAGSKFSLLVDVIPRHDDIVWDLSTKLVTVTDANSAWSFDLLHLDELVDSSKPGTYLLKDWQMLGKGGVYAKKVYNRSKPDQFTGMSTYQEKTTLELIHKPR